MGHIKQSSLVISSMYKLIMKISHPDPGRIIQDRGGVPEDRSDAARVRGVRTCPWKSFR